MRKLGVSRDELFAEIGRRSKPFRGALSVCRVEEVPGRARLPRRDADHYYSVPSRLIREQLEARVTDTTIEILYKGVRVASHARSQAPRRHTTIPEHMPSAHRRYAEWTPARMRREAATIGPATIALVDTIMKAKPHPEQGFRAWHRNGTTPDGRSGATTAVSVGKRRT
jgi:transposase